MKDFIIGVNYWASHAGTNMWRDWNEEVVRADISFFK
jgi:endo-1,4-beta-mannosidase